MGRASDRKRGGSRPLAAIYGAPLVAAAILIAACQLTVRLFLRPRWKIIASVAAGLGLFTASLFLFLWGKAPQPIGDTLSEVREFSLEQALDPTRIIGLALAAGAYFVVRLWQYQKDRADGRPTYPHAVVDSLIGGRYSGACLGIGGVGKTTLLQYLHYDQMRSSRHNAPFLRSRKFRDVDIEDMIEGTYQKGPPKAGEDGFEIGAAIREYHVTGDLERFKVAHRRHMYDVRGQEVGRAGHWSHALGEIWPWRRRAMIVNVMTYGYSASVMKRADIVAALDRRADPGVLAAFRQEKRGEEIRGLADIVSAVDAAWPQGYRGKLIFKNMVNMAGFWWDRREEVERHYRSEPFVAFEATLRRIVEERGGRLVMEPFIPVSFLFDDMWAKTGREGPDAKVLVFKVQDGAREELKARTLKAIDAMRADLFRLNWPRGGGLS